MTQTPQAPPVSEFTRPAQPNASLRPPFRPPLIDRYRLWVLLLITLIGGLIRFAYLDRPALWGDEALTFSRVCGDFREMLDILIYDGFPPLHYEAYWLLHKIPAAHALSPRAMRLIPAVTGTLMVPAMYFLASQIVRRRTALLAAIFTCVSAYMMVYSRDAKMYMPAWLFITLNVGCFLAWLRTGRRVLWLAWIATGLAMAGFHLSSLAVLALEPVILLTFLADRARFSSPVPSPQSSVLSPKSSVLLALVGIFIISAGPAGYRLGFNHWNERIEEVGFAAGSGLSWVEGYNRERSGPDLALFAATAHLFSWEWPTPSIQKLKPGIHPDVMHALMIVGVSLLVLFAVGQPRPSPGNQPTPLRSPHGGNCSGSPSGF